MKWNIIKIDNLKIEGIYFFFYSIVESKKVLKKSLNADWQYISLVYREIYTDLLKISAFPI